VVFHSSGCRQDVSRLAVALFVEENEEGYSCICGLVSEMSASKVRASETWWFASEAGDS